MFDAKKFKTPDAVHAPGYFWIWNGPLRRSSPRRCSSTSGLCGSETGSGNIRRSTSWLWRKFLRRKSFYDLTGNGVNHPDDYGHRIYASVILEVFTGEPYF